MFSLTSNKSSLAKNRSPSRCFLSRSSELSAEIEKYKWVNDEKLYSDNAFVHDNHLSRHCIGLSGMKFTDEEIDIFNKALQDISKKIGSLNISY